MQNRDSRTAPFFGGGAVPSARGRRLSLAALTLVAAGLVALGGRSARAGDPGVPLKSSLAGTVTPTGDGVHFALEGAGISSHLGRISYRGEVAIETLDPVTGAITDVLIETLIAANGDTVTLLCHESAEQLSPNIFHGTDQWTVIGGTGRFKNATGAGTADTFVDLNKLTFAKTVTGTITVGR